jgi:hypothetical protein
MIDNRSISKGALFSSEINACATPPMLRNAATNSDSANPLLGVSDFWVFVDRGMSAVELLAGSEGKGLSE